jgi:hypothetical protein
MYGTLAGALSGRKIPFDRQHYTATVDGRIVGIGKTIRIESIAVHYELTIPAESQTCKLPVQLLRGTFLTGFFGHPRDLWLLEPEERELFHRERSPPSLFRA